jgi:hypothetical protein
MKKLLYLDCFAGISGDMFLGAMIDLGVAENLIRSELGKLKLPGYSLTVRQVVKQNIAATKFDCIEEVRHAAILTKPHEHHAHRGYTEIAGMIQASGLSEPVKQRALRVFRRIGEAEARIHGIPLDQIHFHEVGAIDSIVDIIGACIALEALGVDNVQASPPRLGSGFVQTAHGRFPVPAPATLELLKGLPVQPSNDPIELVTPTGAALLAEFCNSFGPMPAMTITKVGYGAGTKDLDKTPNVLRAVLGEMPSAAEDEESDSITVIETNIDDMNPQWFGDVMERLLAAGALDVYYTPIQMKKSRPATMLTVLCEQEKADALIDIVLAHTTSFGVRIHEERRQKLARSFVSVDTLYGNIQVKIGRRAGKIVSRSPEYDSCRQAAAQYNVPVKTVYQAALQQAEKLT